MICIDPHSPYSYEVMAVSGKLDGMVVIERRLAWLFESKKHANVKRG